MLPPEARRVPRLQKPRFSLRRPQSRPPPHRAPSWLTDPLGPIPVNVCGLEWGFGGLVSREREAAVTGVFAPWELGKAANRAPPHFPPESQKPPPVAAPLGEAPDSRAQLLAEAGAPRGVPPGSLPASAVVHAAVTTTHVTEESVSRGMRRGAEETPGAWEGPGAGGVGGSRGDTPRGVGLEPGLAGLQEERVSRGAVLRAPGLCRHASP